MFLGLRPGAAGASRACVMADSITIELTVEERGVMVQAVQRAYRDMHREAWEVKTSGDPKYLSGCEARLRVLEEILRKAGSSADEAMRSVWGKG